MHPVVTSNPSEHRLKRIKSQEPADHRITFGCINVPASFYTGVVLTAFSGGAGVVYILPESRPLEEVFPGLTAVDAAASEKQDVQGASPDQGQRPPPQ